jgi:phosphomevalonate kinase
MTEASAPGKILITGEYAVLEGHVAVVAAVSRRVVARISESDVEPTPFIERAVESLSQSVPNARDALRNLDIDSSALFTSDGNKLGLGSSAASIVASVALALGSDADRHRILRLAYAAHGSAQQHRGSGADVAAAVFGGVSAVRTSGVEPVDVAPLELPAGLTLLAVWTGTSAHTPTLVEAVREGAKKRPSEHRLAIAHIAAASRCFIDACEAGNAGAAVAAVHEGAQAVAALAGATDVPLVTQAHRTIRALASSRGGASKPTGAGGGDLALAAFADPAQAERFRADLQLSGMKAVELAVDPRGVEIDSK